MPSHSRIVVAVPMKKRVAFVSSSFALDGWTFVDFASGKALFATWSLVGRPEVEGSIIRCFIVVGVTLGRLRFELLPAFQNLGSGVPL